MMQTLLRQPPSKTFLFSWLRLAFAVMLALGLAGPANGQEEQFNYDESKVKPYTLPDPLIMQDGRPVTSAAMWRGERRDEILHLFESQVYGRRRATRSACDSA